MFAGNVGAAQSVDTIIQAAALIKEIPNLRWHIVGDGSELERIKRLAKELKAHNVIFHGRKPLAEMPKYYAMADAMLVTMQKDPVLSLTLPGKVQTYMAAGKPILGAIDGETQIIVAEAACGNCCGAAEAEQFAAVVRRFVENGHAADYSRNSLAYGRQYFSKNQFIDKLEEELSKAGSNHEEISE